MPRFEAPPPFAPERSRERVAGRVAPHGSPHHRTCRSASGGSSSARQTTMFLDQADEPFASQRSCRQGMVHVAGPGVPPRAVPVVGAGRRTHAIQARPAEFLEAGAGPTPLPPHGAAQLPSEPLIPASRTPPSLPTAAKGGINRLWPPMKCGLIRPERLSNPLVIRFPACSKRSEAGGVVGGVVGPGPLGNVG